MRFWWAASAWGRLPGAAFRGVRLLRSVFVGACGRNDSSEGKQQTDPKKQPRHFRPLVKTPLDKPRTVRREFPDPRTHDRRALPAVNRQTYCSATKLHFVYVCCLSATPHDTRTRITPSRGVRSERNSRMPSLPHCVPLGGNRLRKKGISRRSEGYSGFREQVAVRPPSLSCCGSLGLRLSRVANFLDCDLLGLRFSRTAIAAEIRETHAVAKS